METTTQKTTKKKELRRQSIILGATKVFCKTGIKSATVDDICDEIGCSHGLFYHYYTNKSELVDYLKTVQNVKIAERALKALASSNDPVIKIKNLLLDIENSLQEDTANAFRLHFFLSCVTNMELNSNLSDDELAIEVLVVKKVRDTVLELENKGCFKDDFAKGDYVNAIISAVAGNVLSFILAAPSLVNHMRSLNVDLLLSLFLKKEAIENAEKENV